METNKTSLPLKYYGLAITAFAVLCIVLSSILILNYVTSSNLNSYVVKVTPPIQEENFEKARLALESSIFQSVNDSILQDKKLTYSEALDNLLPISENVAYTKGGFVVVVRNYGKTPAHNVQININLEAPIEKYEIFSKEAFSVLDEDKSNGTLRISVDKINAVDEITIAILLPDKYAVTLTASRADDIQPPILPTSLTVPEQKIGILLTQTAVASYNQDNADKMNLLEFQVNYEIDKIQLKVLVSSGERQSSFYGGGQRNKTKEQNLFVETFLK